MSETAKSTVDEEQLVDFVSVGSGVAGAAGAVTAANLGLETVLIEKEAELGGSTVDSFGILFQPNNHLQAAIGVNDSLDDGREYMHWMGAGLESSDHVDNYLHVGPIALKYFAEEHEIPFYIVKNLPDHHYPKAPGSRPLGRMLQVQPFSTKELGKFKLAHSPYIERLTFEEMSQWGGRYAQDLWDEDVLAEREAQDVRTFGAGLVGHFLSAAIRSKVQILNDASLERLVMEDGAIKGVIFTREGKRTLLRARKGVLLATGNPGRNEYLMRWLNSEQTHTFSDYSDTAGSWTSEGLGAALEFGAAMAIGYDVVRSAGVANPLQKNPDGQPWLFILRDFGAPHSIIVNREGKRFTNEADFRGQTSREVRVFDTEHFRYKNDPCFFIFDQTYVDEVGLGSNHRGSSVPEWVTRGDTVTELAAGMEIDPIGLDETINRFNRFCDNDCDSDFHLGEIPFYQAIAAGTQQAHPNPQLGKLSRPPFYGIQVRIRNLSCPAGLVTNLDAQVLHWNGEPIPGLYATGIVTAPLFHGVGHNAGLHISGGITYGYLAARHAANSST